MNTTKQPFKISKERAREITADHLYLGVSLLKYVRTLYRYLLTDPDKVVGDYPKSLIKPLNSSITHFVDDCTKYLTKEQKSQWQHEFVKRDYTGCEEVLSAWASYSDDQRDLLIEVVKAIKDGSIRKMTAEEQQELETKPKKADVKKTTKAKKVSKLQD